MNRIVFLLVFGLAGYVYSGSTVNTIGCAVPTPVMGGDAEWCRDTEFEALYWIADSEGNPDNTQPYTYIWEIPDGATLLEDYGHLILVIFPEALVGEVRVTAVDPNCGNAQSATAVYPVTVGAEPPEAGPISGPLVACPNETGLVFSVDPVPGAMGYIWTVPSEARIVAGDNTAGITVDMGGFGGTVSVRPTNGCPQNNPTRTTVHMGPPAQATSFDMPGVICNNEIVTITANPVAGATGYTWNVEAPSVILSGQGNDSIQVQYIETVPTSGLDFDVTATNPCGSSSLWLDHIPSNSAGPLDGMLTGPTEVGVGEAVTYTYTGDWLWDTSWILPDGVEVIEENYQDITLRFTQAVTNAAISFTHELGCGPETPVSINVTASFNCDVPEPVIDGDFNWCSDYPFEAWLWVVGDNGDIDFSGRYEYEWTLPESAQITRTEPGIIYVLFPEPLEEEISVVRIDPLCGNLRSDPVFTTMTVLAPVPQAGPIEGVDAVCPGASGMTYTVAPVEGATTYTWQVPTGSQITAGEGTNSITVTFGDQSGQVRVQPSNGCNFNGPEFTVMEVLVGPPPATYIVNYPDTNSICSDQVYTFHANPVKSATGYTWNVGDGWEVVSGQGTDTAAIRALDPTSSTSLYIELSAENACGTGPIEYIDLTSLTLQPLTGTIVGPELVCLNQPTTFSYSANDNYSAEWNLPPGAVIVEGEGTRTISVRFTQPVTDGVVSMSHDLGCNAPAPVSKLITVDYGGFDPVRIGAAQGFQPVAVALDLDCESLGSDLNISWINENTGATIAEDVLMTTLPFFGETTSVLVQFTDQHNSVQAEARFVVLVPPNGPVDVNGDGCATPDDLFQALSNWSNAPNLDPNRDGSSNILDLLYVAWDEDDCPQ